MTEHELEAEYTGKVISLNVGQGVTVTGKCDRCSLWQGMAQFIIYNKMYKLDVEYLTSNITIHNGDNGDQGRSDVFFRV